jgi:hypothetical protein
MKSAEVKQDEIRWSYNNGRRAGRPSTESRYRTPPGECPFVHPKKGEQRNAEDIFQFSRFGAYRQPPEGVAMLTAVLQTVLIVTAAVGLIVTVLDIRRGSA